MERKRILTGIQPTGTPHIGNYFGAIKPAITMINNSDLESYMFIADYHALNASQHDKKIFEQDVFDVAATWIACGINPSKTTLYCQSDIPEIMELTIILSNFCSKGLLNRAHSYKDKTAKNLDAGEKDEDKGINMGLYLYPLLMASDILTFNAHVVPVGPDQLQHLEITRDIAQRFNHYYGKIITIPEPLISTTVLIPGLDERKMSKSYNNHIPLFLDDKNLQKHINRIKTDSSLPTDPKDPDKSLIFTFYKLFANSNQQESMDEKFRKGVSWGEVKAELFSLIQAELKGPRETYLNLMSNKDEILKILREGCEKARAKASENLRLVKRSMGKK